MKGGLLMTWKAQTDEPFAVDFLRHFFEQGDAAIAVFDQVIMALVL